MNPCTIEELHEALSRLDTLGTYDMRNMIVKNEKSGTTDPFSLPMVRYSDDPITIRKIPLIEPTYPIEYGDPDASEWWSLVSSITMIIDEVGVKPANRHKDGILAYFNDYKDVDGLATAVIKQIRRRFDIKSVF